MLARIADETITYADVDEYVARNVPARALLGTEQGTRRLLEELALIRALMREGAQKGMACSSGERFDGACAEHVRRALLPACSPPRDEAETKAWYDRHPDAFRIPARARVARVVLRATDTVDGMPAEAWLWAQAQAVSNGKRRFEEVVAQAQRLHPDDRMGDLGFLDLSERSPVVQALAQAKVGELVGPYRDAGNVFLFRVLERREAQVLPWEQVSRQAAARAVEYCREQENAKLKESLLEKYHFTVDEEALRAAVAPLAAARRPQGPDVTR